MKNIKQKPVEKVWQDFQKAEYLSKENLEKFKKYKKILSEWNREMNLTAIKDLSGIVRQHFVDSLALRNFIDLKKVKTIADVGAGAGFPAIPLKIVFPHLSILLIEPKKKKQRFLNALIEELELKNVEICDLDWRTFLRTTKGNIDLFVSRAAFDEVELCRMFRSNSAYNTSKLVYWVAQEWESEPRAEKYFKGIKEYKLGKKLRKLSFWGL